MAPPPSSNPAADDALLLRCYVRDGSEAAFRSLAERHLPLVWSVARRVVNGDAALAEDVAQTVLADFALKAHSLPPGTVAAAWLHRHTVFTASKAVRSEVRRRARELISAENESSDLMDAPSHTWADVSPHIDAALDRLPEADRSAVVLRYYEQRPLREVGRAIGTTEEAARKRIDRALTKLRSHLRRRGVVPAAAILAAMLSENSIAAPSDALAQHTISGAWQRVEAGVVSHAAPALIPWWRRQSILAAAAVFLVCGTIWILLSGGSRAHPPDNGAGLRKIPVTNLPNEKSRATMTSVKLTATVITLPEKSVAARMLRFQQGKEDAALYRELLPQAQALQKQLPLESLHATAGMPLVVLSGEAAIKTMTEKPPSATPESSSNKEDSTVEPADPFAAPAGGFSQADPFAPAGTTPAPPSLHVQQSKEFSYATEWPYDTSSGLVTAGDFTVRNVGTVLDANIYQPASGSTFLVECSVDHMLEPKVEEWPYAWPQHERNVSEKRRESAKIRQPRLCSIKLSATVQLPAAGDQVLAAMTAAAPGSAGKSLREPQRAFLFLKLEP